MTATGDLALAALSVRGCPCGCHLRC